MLYRLMCRVESGWFGEIEVPHFTDGVALIDLLSSCTLTPCGISTILRSCVQASLFEK